MKLTALFLLAATLQVSARTYAQKKVTLHEKNAKLDKVFQEIRQQTGYTFLLNQTWLEGVNAITIDVDDVTIQEALDKCLKGQPYSYSIVATTIILKPKEGGQKAAGDPPAASPPKDIHGTILNEKGEPIEGAYVIVKGTRLGSATDAKGMFTILNVEGDAPVLEVTFVGYQKETVKWTGQSDLTVKLKVEIKALQDVAISYSTGYQTIPRERATGSFDLVDNKTYNRGVSTDVLSRLDGLANSLYFRKSGGTDNEIYIRGTSSLMLSSQPLIILDNFPYTGDYNNINPNDIETVTVLKDAAAASIWGARAGNGVIVLTSKKGKYNQNFQLSLNANASITDKPDIFKNRAFMKSTDFIDVEKYLFDQGFYDADFTSYDHRVISPVVQTLLDQRNGVITAAEANKRIDSYRGLDNRGQIKQYMYSKQINQQYSLSMSGGNQVINYYLSGGYDRNGNVSGQNGNNFEKQTVHSFAGFKPINNLDLQVGIDYAHTAVKSSFVPLSGVEGGKGVYYPYAMLADPNGNPLTLPRGYAQSFKDTAGGGKLLDWNYRPLAERNSGNFSQLTNDLLFNIAIKYSLLKSLQISVQYQHEWNSGQTKNISSLQTYNTRNLINQFTQDNGGGQYTYPVPIGGVINLSNSTLTRDNVRPMVSFIQTFAGHHEITAVAGFEVNQSRSTSTSIPTGYGYNPDNLTTQNVDNINYYTFFDGIGGSTIPASLGFGEQLNRFVSYFANVGYTYNRKYTVTASARKDQSNLFGVNTNNRGVPLWSSGVSWKLSQEGFYKFGLIPNLSLRATYGFSGNSSPELPALAVIGYSPNAYFTGLPYAEVANPPNPDLRWEKIGQLNLGVDFGIKGGVLSGSLEYYRKNGVDLLSLVPADITTGYNFLTKNAANMITNGVDVNVNVKVGRSEGFSWTSMINVNYVKNKVTKYLLKRTSAADYVASGGSISPVEGEDPYTIRVYKFAGLDPQTGDPQGYVNKQLSKDYNKLVAPASIDDLVEMGTNRPPVFGNIINTFSWKGLSVSANINGRFGYNLRKSTIMYSDLFNSWSQNIEFAARWQKPGDEAHTTVPSMVYPINSNRDRFYQNSDANIIKGDVIRLQDLRINYDFKPIKLGAYTLKQLSLYLYATNIAIIWKANKDGIDPDYPNGAPAPRMFAAGVRTTF